jgi:GDP-D-mannose dehydratase
MWLMLQQEKPDDYVLATGKNHTIREFCELAFKELDILKLNEGKIGKELEKIFQYLEVDSGDINITEYYKSVFNTSYNASNEIDKIGQYKRYFNERHYSLLNSLGFRSELNSLNYE